jgi:hypothetical protein
LLGSNGARHCWPTPSNATAPTSSSTAPTPPPAASGTAPYVGAIWTAASDVDIDHVATLKYAWFCGAWAWITTKGESFANDLSEPKLFAVTDNINESRGDKSPDARRPPLASYYCTYAKAWTRDKYVWALTVTTAEKPR